MLCSRFLKNEHARRHGRLYLLFERGFDAMLHGYEPVSYTHLTLPTIYSV